MQTLFLVLHLIVSVILIFVVMAQEGKDPGMRGIQGASSDMGDSFFKKNGGTTKEAMFIKLTTTIAILKSIESINISVPIIITTPEKSCVTPCSNPSPTASISFITRLIKSPCGCPSIYLRGTSLNFAKISRLISLTVI